MATPDRFGDQLDADTIETALRTALQAWLPAHLAHQERRKGWPQGKLPQPRSWPVVSELELDPQDLAPPAVVILSTGTTGANERLPDGTVRRRWTFEIAVVLADRSEREARQLASAYLTAIAGAATQVPSLNGAVEQVRWTGPDDYAYGTAPKGAGRRAIYATAFTVTGRLKAPAVPITAAPGELYPLPPADPYHPEPAPDLPLEVQIDVAVTSEDQAP